MEGEDFIRGWGLVQQDYGNFKILSGVLLPHGPYGTMLGGYGLNVSGPCFRPGNVILLQIDEQTIDCNMVSLFDIAT